MGDKSVGHRASLLLLLECAFMTKKKASKKFSLQESLFLERVCACNRLAVCVCVFIFQLDGSVLDLGHQVPLRYEHEMLIILQQECQTLFFGTQEKLPTARNFQSPSGHSSFQLLCLLIFCSALKQFSAVYSYSRLVSRYPVSRYSVFVLCLPLCCGR